MQSRFGYTLILKAKLSQPPVDSTLKKGHFVFQVDLRHNDEIRGSNVVEIGVDLSEFYPSVEWDILEVPAVR